MSITTITVSEPVKNELEDIRDRHEDIGNLNEAVLHVCEENLGGSRRVTGYEETLTETVKVTEFTRHVLKLIRDREGYQDYDEVIRKRAGLAVRDTGKERPVEVAPLPD